MRWSGSPRCRRIRWRSAERLEQLRLLAHDIPIYVEQTPYTAIGVDTEADLKRVCGNSGCKVTERPLLTLHRFTGRVRRWRFTQSEVSHPRYLDKGLGELQERRLRRG